MSSYKNYLISSALLFLLTGCNNIELTTPIIKSTINNAHFKKQNIKDFNLENEYIMYALEYESQKNYKLSREIYFKLFENTNNHEYLVNYLNLSYILKDYKNVKTLWASTREILNLFQAEKTGCHIITIPPAIIEKIESFGKSFDQLTKETVQAFLVDSKKSNFKI